MSLHVILWANTLYHRNCPGRYLASATIWLIITSVLSLFDIGPKMDEDGNEIPVEADFTDGVVA